MLGGRCGTVLCGDPITSKHRWGAALRDPVEHLQLSPDRKHLVVRTRHRFSVFQLAEGKYMFIVARGQPALC